MTAERREPMAKRKNDKSNRASSKEEERLQAIYAKSLREFTAADLQKFTVIEKGIPLEKVIEEMEKIQKNYKPKKR
jgi:thymidylate kinase